MTAAELVKLLKKVPADSRVICANSYTEFDLATVKTLPTAVVDERAFVMLPLSPYVIDHGGDDDDD